MKNIWNCSVYVMKISKIVESYNFAKVVQNKHEDIKFMLFLQIQTHEI